MKQVKKNSGFTLIEVLVALSIMTVIFSLLFSGFRLANKSWDKGIENNIELTNYQASYKLLNQWLSHLYPTAINDVEYVFQGSDRQLRFTGFMPGYPTRGGLYEVLFSIEQTDDLAGTKNLVVYRRPYNPPDNLNENSIDFYPDQRIILLKNINDNAAFEFFGMPAGDQQPIWSSIWPIDRTIHLTAKQWHPHQIRLKSLGRNLGREGWPDLVVPIRVTMDSRCTSPYSADYNLCRDE